MPNIQKEVSKFGLPSDVGGKDIGLFLPIGTGAQIISEYTRTVGGSFEYAKNAAVIADTMDYDFVMSPSTFVGCGGSTRFWHNSLESNTLMSALATHTSRIRLITSVHPLLHNPGVMAKMISTLDQISNGRVGVNLVTSFSKLEFGQMGAWRDDFPTIRYEMAEEWITAINRLWSEELVSLNGKYFKLDHCESAPKPTQRPFLICAGTSLRGMMLAAQTMDGMFVSGETETALADISARLKAMASDVGRAIKVYTLYTLVIAETDIEAEAQAAEIIAGFDKGAWEGMMRLYNIPEDQIEAKLKPDSAFTSQYLVGSTQTVGQKLIEKLVASGLDGIMLAFPDYTTSLLLFAREIIPQIRARFPGASGF